MRISKNLLFIVWYNHSRRAETMATELSGQVEFIYECGLSRRWLIPLRYLIQSWRTWQLLERERPETVIVQAPPIVAPLCVAAWCSLRRKEHRIPFAIDCHTGTFYERKWSWALPLLRFLARRAAVTVVASEEALRTLQHWRVNSVFLVDGLPRLGPPTGRLGSETGRRVAVVSSFDADEPVPEVFAAARLLPHVTFYLSGDAKRAPSDLLAQKPPNITLTGFLPDDVYAGLLTNVEGLVVLTKEPNILNCGAYEALAAGQPAVLSNWPQMRRYFTRGFVYVSNTPEGIAAGVQEMLDKQPTLEQEIVAGRSDLITTRQPNFDRFVALLTGSERTAAERMGSTV